MTNPSGYHIYSHNYEREPNRRGPKRFVFTWKDLEELTGVNRRTIIRAARLGRVDLQSLASILDYAVKRRGFVLTYPRDRDCEQFSPEAEETTDE